MKIGDDGKGRMKANRVMFRVPFWGALFYAVKIRREEGGFEEGLVKGVW